MCGICGQYNFTSGAQVDPQAIERMMDTIVHRGPDDSGLHLDGPLGLGFRRLAIIDLSPAGHQPMSDRDESVWIVFNGEIYNYQSLRQDLHARGHVFRSQSDTEVIIHLYKEYGLDCLRHLRGMFGFAIWDQRRRRLFIARDRVGIKPLYYCQTLGTLYFASELKAILTDPAVSREINPGALRQFFSFNYVPGEETMFKSIRKLPPGHYLVAEDGKVSIQRYWDLSFNRARASRSFDEVVEELYGLLGSTVRDHMIADVPVGVLLSGGVDSSAVLSYAVQGTTKKIKTFTVGFDGDQVVDERPYARLAAERFGTEHYELTISADDFWDFLPRYVWHMEEPVCEPPAVALYYVSKLARGQVKVLLSGEGGDEAFAGYPNYPNMLQLDRLSRALGPLARLAGAATGLIGGLFGLERIQRYAAALGRPLAENYYSRSSDPTSFFNRNAGQLFTPGFLASTANDTAAATMAGLLRPTRDWPLLDQMLYADTKTWLPDDLLIKADKITMANSLELRVPLLDHQVLEFAASLPSDYKVRGRETKRALKAAFAKELPTEVINRKKAGFPVPYAGWMRKELRGKVEEILLSDQTTRRGYFQRGEVEKLLKANQQTGNYPKEVFSLLVIEFWHRQFIDTAT